MLGVGREDAVEPNHVLSGLRDSRRQSAEELDWGEQDVGLSCVEGFAEFEPDAAVWQQGQSLLREGRA